MLTRRGSLGQGMHTKVTFWAVACLVVSQSIRAQQIVEFPLPTPNSYPDQITAGPDGALWFTNLVGDKIGRIALDGTVTEFPTPSSPSVPTGITVGPDGNLWFTESQAARIGRITPTGSITEFPVPPASGHSLNEPVNLAAGPDGALWFTEPAGNRVGRMTTGGVVTSFPLLTLAAGPSAITTGPDDALWFTEIGANKIGRISVAGLISEYPVPSVNAQPTGITLGPDGALWFTENATSKIGRIDTSGHVTEFEVSGQYPLWIASGPDNRLWFGIGPNYVASITTSGIVELFPIPTAGGQPQGMALGPDGALWFTENLANQIGRLQLASGGNCVQNPLTLCLSGGRFSVTASWQTANDSGSGTGVRLTGDSGYFWFFDPANVELVVKVLDGCSSNGHFWVFAGGLTNVGVGLSVTDTKTGLKVTYANDAGVAFAPIQDTSALRACP